MNIPFPFHVARLLLLPAMTAPAALAADQLFVSVRETAGIARPSYPVSAQLRIPAAAADSARMRLLADDARPMVAQFRTGPTAGGDQLIWLDFQTDLQPWESKTYTVQYGADVEPGPQRGSGHRLTETPTEWQIENAPYLTWIIPRDPGSLLKSFRVPTDEFVRAGSPGLTIIDRSGTAHALADVSSDSMVSRVVRRGPLAVALQIESTMTPAALQGVRSTIDLHFPVSRSWVEVDWKLTDPDDVLQSQQAGVHLQLDKSTADAPTLVDFGTTTLVYTALYPQQSTELRADGTAARPAGRSDAGSGEDRSRNTDPSERRRQLHPNNADSWTVLRGPAGQLQPFFAGPANSAVRAEGWAHVMDRNKCLALAVGEFARSTSDRIHISAEGSVTLERSFPVRDTERDDRDVKRLWFWLHFVRFPPQQGAATSPQAMQNPVEVRVTRGTARN